MLKTGDGERNFQSRMRWYQLWFLLNYHNTVNQSYLLKSSCIKGFSGGASGKEPTCQCRRLKRSESGRSPGGGHGNPLQYSCLENPHGQKGLVGYSPWGHKGLDMTEQACTYAKHSANAFCACYHWILRTVLWIIHVGGELRWG